jgi:hypothetical protein
MDTWCTHSHADGQPQCLPVWLKAGVTTFTNQETGIAEVSAYPFTRFTMFAADSRLGMSGVMRCLPVASDHEEGDLGKLTSDSS